MIIAAASTLPVRCQPVAHARDERDPRWDREPDDDPRRFPDGPLAEIPCGKQNWYGPQSGIWQSIYIETLDLDHIERVAIKPDLRSGTVHCAIHLGRPAREPLELEVFIHDADGVILANGDEKGKSGAVHLLM